METWIKWTERQPQNGELIIAIHLDYTYGRPAYNIVFTGGAIISLVESSCKNILDNIYWIKLPVKG